MEDDLRWKMTFDGRQPLMEDDLRWKTTFDGRRLSMFLSVLGSYGKKFKKVYFDMKLVRKAIYFVRPILLVVFLDKIA